MVITIDLRAVLAIQKTTEVVVYYCFYLGVSQKESSIESGSLIWLDSFNIHESCLVDDSACLVPKLGQLKVLGYPLCIRLQ